MNIRGKTSVRFLMASLLMFASLFSLLVPTGAAEARARTDAPAFHDAMRKLWEDTFRALRELLAYAKTVLNERKDGKRKGTEAPEGEDSFDFGDFGESAPEGDATVLDASLDFGAADRRPARQHRRWWR